MGFRRSQVRDSVASIGCVVLFPAKPVDSGKVFNVRPLASLESYRSVSGGAKRA